MQVEINFKKYELLSGYQKTDRLRHAFNDLCKKVFELSFENWYQYGYWNDKYIPYTLFDENKAIANVSVNIMDLYILGEQKKFAQIGAVMTDEKHRHKNLCRFLTEKVMSDFQNFDLIYLFANESAVNLYPKFGFEKKLEYEYVRSPLKSVERVVFEKLDMSLQKNRDMLYQYAKNSRPFGKLMMHENADLVMFYCTSFFKDYVYYIPSLDVIVVSKMDNKKLEISDVFGKNDIELEKVINVFESKQFDEVVLGFTPQDITPYKSKQIIGKDTLFVEQDKVNFFDENKMMFPVLSHA